MICGIYMNLDPFRLHYTGHEMQAKQIELDVSRISYISALV